MYLTVSLMPPKSAISASGIFHSIFGHLTVAKQRKSEEAFPFFVEVIRRWSNNWSQLDMDDVITFVGCHTDFHTGQKDKAWELFQHVSPVKKAAWVAACRERKNWWTNPRSVYPAGSDLTIPDNASLKQMVKGFTVETAGVWPKLNEKKGVKRKTGSSKSGKGKKAKKVELYESEPESEQ
jgi:hypothetical protein